MTNSNSGKFNVAKGLIVGCALLLIGGASAVQAAVTIYVPEGGAVRAYDGATGGNTDGFFTPQGTNVGRIALADLDGDGIDDFIVPHADAIRVYNGVGGHANSVGSFGGGFLTGSASNVGGVFMRDMNGDGIDDFILPQTDAVRWYDGAGGHGNIGGFFTSQGTNVGRIAMADLDGDGIDDFIVPHADAVRFYNGVGFGNSVGGAGGFLTSQGTNVGGVFMRDLDGDGIDDFILPQADAVRFYNGAGFGNSVGGAGGFLTSQGTNVGRIAMADLDGDGIDDFIVPHADAVRFYNGVGFGNSVGGSGGFLTISQNNVGGVLVVIPEPATLALMLLGAGLMIRRRQGRMDPKLD